MLQKVHLKDRFLRGHRLYGEFLLAHDLEIPLLLIREICGFGLFVEDALTQAFFKPCLIFAYLALNGGDGGVYGGVHVAGTLAYAVKGAVVLYGDLGVEIAPRGAESYKGFRIPLKKPVYFPDFALGILFDFLRYLDFFLRVF